MGDVSGTVAAVGEQARLTGFVLCGVQVCAAETADAVRQAWRDLPDTTAVVILTAHAAATLGPELVDPRGPLTVVLPA